MQLDIETACSDPKLCELRNQIKKVMIPLLIKIFELKFSAQQANHPPSRLFKPPEESPEEIRDQLKKLNEDLKLLQLWVSSCQKQISKALDETELNPPSLQKERVHSGAKVQETEKSSFMWLKKWIRK